MTADLDEEEPFGCQLLDMCEECGARLEPTHEAFGRHYGYPPCCTYEFVEWSHVIDIFRQLDYDVWEYGHPRRPRLLSGTGFIPCAYHSMVCTEPIMIGIIESKRECKVSFAQVLKMMGWFQDVPVSEKYL